MGRQTSVSKTKVGKLIQKLFAPASHLFALPVSYLVWRNRDVSLPTYPHASYYPIQTSDALGNISETHQRPSLTALCQNADTPPEISIGDE